MATTKKLAQGRVRSKSTRKTKLEAAEARPSEAAAPPQPTSDRGNCAAEDERKEQEAMDARWHRIGREKGALRSSPADDSLRARLLTLLGGNMYAKLDEGMGVSQERAMFRYAAATTKAVAMALKGHDYVCSNEHYDTAFTEDEAAIVLCGLSALLDVGPDLVESIRGADQEVQP